MGMVRMGEHVQSMCRQATAVHVAEGVVIAIELKAVGVQIAVAAVGWIVR